MDTQALQPDFGRTITKQRRKLGLSQRQIVEILQQKGIEITWQQYSKIENNRLLPSQDVVDSLSEILSINKD
jgi:ribosome-binding protein aMBF1 (putative translation factor)